jgi:hypothetical protein
MNSRVLVFSPQAKLIREINLAKSEYSFDRAMAIAIDKKVLYVADSLKHRIRRFTLQGKWLGDINLTAPIPKPVPEPEAVDSEKSKAEVKTEISTALPEAVVLLIRDDELIYHSGDTFVAWKDDPSASNICHYDQRSALWRSVHRRHLDSHHDPVKVETDTQTDLPFPHACPCSVSLYHWGVLKNKCDASDDRRRLIHHLE